MTNQPESTAEQKLRLALAKLELAPEITEDDKTEDDSTNRAVELEANRPPHHG